MYKATYKQSETARARTFILFCELLVATFTLGRRCARLAGGRWWKKWTSIKRGCWKLIVVILFCSHCIRQVLDAVMHCHTTGVIHRDLKVCSSCHILTPSVLRPHRFTWAFTTTFSPVCFSLYICPSSVTHQQRKP